MTGERTLRKLMLDQVKALAKSLCSETVELQRPKPNSTDIDVLEFLQPWLENLESKAAALIEIYTEDRQNEKLVRAALAVIREFRQRGGIFGNGSSEARSLVAEKSINKDLQGWSEVDVIEAQQLVRIARGLGQVDAELTTCSGNFSFRSSRNSANPSSVRVCIVRWATHARPQPGARSSART